MVHSPLRIARPAIREGWREGKPRTGTERFHEVSWDEALDAVAAELARVRETFGHNSILGGSYGWSSAGRVHHARSLVRRFLFLGGGCVDQVGNYSFGAAQYLLPRVIGTFQPAVGQITDWASIVKHTRVMFAFGGLATKNGQVTSGGAGAHSMEMWLRRAKDAGIEFVSISPLKSDAPDFLDARWVPIRPNTDTALMLAMAHTLLSEERHDASFVARYCTGFEAFRRYLLGLDDNVPKDAQWAEAITGVPADTIRELARRAAASRSMITCAWSLQRAHHGEQPYWAAIVLAAMLGGIGLPGGGFAFGHGSSNGIGVPRVDVAGPEVPLPLNPARAMIPVARMADMLLHPGDSYEFNGRRYSYPDIRLVYWAGGNPFHHHQDLNRLQRAWQKPETVIVHDSWWTPTTRHADIVLPATTMLERNDVGGSSRDSFVLAMHRAIDPIGEARNDFDIFRALARRLGYETAFTGDRDEMGWCQWVYDQVRASATANGVALPGFQQFWAEGFIELPPPERDYVLFEDFRRDPERHPLKTPSGQDRDRLRRRRRLRVCGLSIPPGLAAAGGMARRRKRRTLAASPGHAPAGEPPAQPDGPGSGVTRPKDQRPRAHPHQPAGRRAARHPRRRHRARVQRPRRLPRRSGHRLRRDARSRRHGNGRVVRSGGYGGSARTARQSQRAHARHRHVAARARNERTHRAHRDRALGRASSASSRVHAAATGACRLVSRFRRSYPFAARARTNVGTKGTLATI